MPRRQVQCPSRASGEMNVPHLLEVAAKVAALTFQEQVHAIAREHLRDLASAQVHDATRPSSPTSEQAKSEKAAEEDDCHGSERQQHHTEQHVERARHAVVWLAVQVD